ncbi:MAG: hypothetical protein ACLQNV_12485 [Steroidobacteraceae bacterium]|jgi:hypothetical protein
MLSLIALVALALTVILIFFPRVRSAPALSEQTPWRRLLAPILVTILLVIWTAVVSPYSKYGDAWAIYPALLALPAVIIWHGALVFLLRHYRRTAALVAACHVGLVLPIWFLCLMLISKDSI